MGKGFKKDDYFKIDPECHLVGDMAAIEHYPGVQMWWKAVEGITRNFMTGMPESALEGLDPEDFEKYTDPETYIGVMDRFGVDIACLLPESMMETVNYTARWFSNEDMAKVVDAHPDRFI